MSDRETDVAHLIDRRGLLVPDEDRAPVVEYWSRIRMLRGAVDERLLADTDIALIWAAVPPDAD